MWVGVGRVGVGVVLVRSYPSLSPGPSGRTTVLLVVLGEGVGKGGGLQCEKWGCRTLEWHKDSERRTRS